MKPKTAPLGSLHPVLFFAGVYVVALVFSIFICSTLFYSCNSSPVIDNPLSEKAEKMKDDQAVAALYP
jgi:hypothetical protein